MISQTSSPSSPVRSRHRVAVLALVAGMALVALACSSSKKADTATANSSTTTAAPTTTAGSGGSTTTAGASGAASVKVATTSLGQVVVDDKGMTLYFYKNDTGSTSTCNGGCASAWPPAVSTGTPSAGDGVTAALTTTTRDDGTKQLVLGGHPLYRFASDTKAGDVNGQDVGDVWYAAGPDGQPVG